MIEFHVFLMTLATNVDVQVQARTSIFELLLAEFHLSSFDAC